MDLHDLICRSVSFQVPLVHRGMVMHVWLLKPLRARMGTRLHCGIAHEQSARKEQWTSRVHARTDTMFLWCIGLFERMSKPGALLGLWNCEEK